MKRPMLALVAAVSLVVAACTGTGDPGRASPAPSAEPWHGGTLRIVMGKVSPSGLDPSNYEGWGSWTVFRCCLLRTLISYNGRPTAEGGTVARPDLAAEMPTVSEDGLTWTFHLKQGLRYAPPFEDTAIVAADIVRALERPVEPWSTDGYGFYYSVIVGYDEYWAGDADSIAGLETPDRYTLVVRLEEPTGDLADRFAKGATAPIPAGAADGHEMDYARFLVASGPYMIEGSEDLDPSLPPDRQEPVAGWVPGRSLTLVRNPSWSAATDDLRAAYADRMEFTYLPWSLFGDREGADRAKELVAAGNVDVDTFWTDAPQLDRFPRSQIGIGEQNVVEVIPMNVAVPPFDDEHVRRAVSLVIDREEIVRRFRERFAPVRIAWHLAPESAVGGLLSEWRPTWSSDPAGDLAAARDEMRRSAYDRDGDGRCDARACEAVRALAQRFDPQDAWGWRWEPIRDALERIGIGLEISEVSWSECQERRLVPEERWGIVIGMCTGWAMDYPNGSTWFQPLLSGEMVASLNPSLLGASADDLEAWGYAITDVPSVDARIDRCLGAYGTAQTECWAQLDQYLSEELVPWVPLFEQVYPVVLSGRVATYSFDQSNGEPAFDRISLVPRSE